MPEPAYNNRKRRWGAPATLGGKGTPMEQTIEAIEAEIATLKEHAIKYRRLAAEHRAADNLVIADKLTEAAADCEARAAELETLLAEQARSAR